MEITAYNFRELRKWNKKASTYRRIRMGVVVETVRGIGIVTHRDKSRVWVSTPPEEGDLSWGTTYEYDVSDVALTDEGIVSSSKLHRYAWGKIRDNAIDNNASHAICRQRLIVNEYADKIKCKKEVRTVTGFMGSSDYTRFIGDGYDFEINLRRPFVPDGDRLLYALGLSDRITTIDGRGNVGNRKILESDVIIGKSINAFNVDKHGNKSWD